MTHGTNDALPTWTGTICAVWGVLGVVGILIFAIVRLAPITVEALAGGLTRLQWSLLVGYLSFMLYTEGYRGFQRSFSPRVAERAAHLRRHPTVSAGLLAPLYCIGYFGSSRRVKITAYALAAGILVLVLLVQHLDQPWRGMVDAGVLAGLSWGVVATLHCGRKALR